MTKREQAREFVDYLNDVLKTDPKALRVILFTRTPVNQGIVEHPTAQCTEIEDQPVMGPLGLINGFFNEDGKPLIYSLINHDPNKHGGIGIYKFIVQGDKQKMKIVDGDLVIREDAPIYSGKITSEN